MSLRPRSLSLLALWLPLLLAILLITSLGFSPAALSLLCRTVPLLQPGLTLTYGSGSLVNGNLRAIRWQQGDTLVELLGVDWEMQPGCLLRSQLCFRGLAIDELGIVLAAASDPAPLDLAPLATPAEIVVQQANVGTLRIGSESDPQLVLENLELAGALRETSLLLNTLSVRRETTSVRISGRIELEKQVPLTLSGDFFHAQSAAQQFAGRFKLGGDLQRLAVEVWLDKPETLALTGSLNPLSSPPTIDVVATRETPFLLPADRGAVNRASLQLAGSLQNLKADLAASVNSPLLGDGELNVSALWDGSLLQLQAFTLRGASGELSGSGLVSLATEPGWDIQVDAAMTCPQALGLDVSCSFAGASTSTGSLTRDGLELELRSKLSGLVNGEPATLNAHVKAHPSNRWELQAVEFSVRDNSAAMRGTIDSSLALSGELTVTDLSQLVPAWAGTGTGRWQLGGSWAQPQFDAAVSLRSLAYADLELAALDMVSRSDAQPLAGSIQLTAQAGAWSGIRIDSATANCAFELTPERSGQVRCRQFELLTESGAERWQLAQAISANWQSLASGITVSPFCLDSSLGSVCSTMQSRFSAEEFSGVHITAENIHVERFQRWLPPGAEIDGSLEVMLDAQKTAATGTRLLLKIGAPVIGMGIQVAGKQVRQSLSGLSANFLVEDQQASLKWSFGIGPGGFNSGDLVVSDWAGEKLLEGVFDVQNLDLRPFALSSEGVLDARGVLNGSVRLQGSATQPLLSGRLRLNDGRLEHEQLPTALEAVSIELEFSGPEAQLQGDYTLPAGSGTLTGRAHWTPDEWLADLHLRSDKLTLEPVRGAEVTVQPDIYLTLTPAKATVRGDVFIPSALIILDRIPPTAQSVSVDTVIVGQEEPANRFDYELLLNLKLGDDVALRGLGANARLTGALQLSRQLEQPLIARGQIDIASGRYVAYGQRLEVSEGKFFFNGPLQRPEIRLTAVRPLLEQNVQVGVRVTGDARRPVVNLFSQPAMEDNLVLYYLLTGHAPEENSNLEFAVASAMLQLGVTGATVGTSGTMDKYGIQDFQIGAEQQEYGTEFNVSGYLSPQLYLRYGVSTFDRVNTLRARYRLRQKLFLEAITGAGNAVDFLYSLDW